MRSEVAAGSANDAPLVLGNATRPLIGAPEFDGANPQEVYMLKPTWGGAAVIALLFVSVSCSTAQPGAVAGGASTSTTSADGWKSLGALSAWRGYKSEAIPTGWREENGTITKTGTAQDLVSRELYGNFEFALDWMLAEGGNAGIMYRATEEYEHIYWSGAEYQLLDDARHPDGKNRLTQAASAYGLYAPPLGVVHPALQWNSTRIVARGNHIEHWLNDQKVVEYEIGSPDWTAKVKASKFGVWPNYMKASRGHIGIQGDHTGLLTLRNMRVKVLP